MRGGQKSFRITDGGRGQKSLVDNHLMSISNNAKGDFSVNNTLAQV